VFGSKLFTDCSVLCATPAGVDGHAYNPNVGFDDYKVILYRQDDGSWVAEIPALAGCYALMETREGALRELQQVFELIAKEYQDRGQALPKDTTEIMHA
jgi:predicted RNase H-like HicB family nuclease